MAGKTLAEKILAAHADSSDVRAGQIVEVSVDFCFGNDITAPLAIKTFKEAGFSKVFDPYRIALIPDHFTPNKDIASAMQVKAMRDFAREQGIPYFYEVGRVGIEHALLPEEGLVLPGEVIVGADSHTCTYGALGAFATGVGSTDLAAIMATGRTWFKVPSSIKVIFKGKLGPWLGGKDLILYTIGKLGVEGARYRALEFAGEVIENLSMADRFSLCNMAIEAGAKVGLIAPDEITKEYVKGIAKRPYYFYQSDPDAGYEAIYEWDVSSLEPLVAFPHIPENVHPVSEARNVVIDQVVIGSCTNGRIEDLRIAAMLFKGRRVHPRVRCLIFPATPRIYRQALEEGLLQIFVKAEAVVSPPTCGPCLGGHMGILAKGERAIATTNRNFVGRMGHPESEVFLSNPAVAAASAITGQITHPGEIMDHPTVGGEHAFSR
ncbi:MAG: 3-isopropylmalate dehydratase large subunit [Syntrophobacterales bacterium]|nr:3-isopropylmalate dehydratase large subunit [Syntrophobacterales bacterium]